MTSPLVPPPVEFDETRAVSVMLTTWRSPRYAVRVDFPTKLMIVISLSPEVTNTMEGPFYAIYDDPEVRPTPVIAVMRESIFLQTYRTTGTKSLWRHLPWPGQEVTAEQMEGTSGMVITGLATEELPNSYSPVDVGDWLIRHPRGFCLIIPAIEADKVRTVEPS